MPRYHSVPSYLPPNPPRLSYRTEYDEEFFLSDAPGSKETITYRETGLFPFYTPDIGWQWYSRNDIDAAIDAEGFDRDLARPLKEHFGHHNNGFHRLKIYYAVKTQKARDAAKKKKQDAARNRAARLQLIPGEGS